MRSRSPHSFRHIADILYQSLKQAFEDVCPERYGAPLTIARADESPSAPTISFQIANAEDLSLQLHVTVSHVGGNVYDITAQVEEGPERCFTYSEPANSGSPLSIAPYLGKKIARHLLDDVEQQLGKLLLRNQVTSEV